MSISKYRIRKVTNKLSKEKYFNYDSKEILGVIYTYLREFK